MKTIFKPCLVLLMTFISMNVFSQMNNWALPLSTLKFAGGNVSAIPLVPLASPAGIINYSSDLYVSDQANHCIRIISTLNGQVSSFVGSGTAGNTNGTGNAAKFNTPTGLTTDGIYIYVADQGNNLIRKIDNSGVVTTLAGSGTAGSTNGTGVAASFNSPTGLAIDGSGNIYVADKLSHKIRKVTSAGVVTTFAGSGTAGSTNGTGTGASFNNPTGITIDGSGNIYVADNGNNLIRKITSAGVVTTFAGSGTAGFTNATGTSASFNSPYDIKYDVSSGNIFVTEKTNNSIRKIITSTQVVSTFAGGTSGSANGTGTAAQFNTPNGLSVDNSGNLYIADYGNNKLRLSSSSADVSDVAVVKAFSQPNGVAIDASGVLYVSDQFNNSIRKFSATGVITDFVGSGVAGNTNGTGNAASFNTPSGLVFDASGNLYVADKANHLIRKIT